MRTPLKDAEDEVSRPKISGAQRRKLRKMREQGIDTSKVKLPPRPQNKTPGNAEITQAVKRTVSDRSTPEEKLTKKSRTAAASFKELSSNYKAAFTGIKTAIIPKEYPDISVT
uniref:Uncharacterized protein LOC114335177 n=1 Tax=Diabrotica virgifera virgifera TaxID=50390 RepID=A0A6P7FXH5_DIAVI